jgi:F-type H+-transporting ATPase subunit b
MPQLDPAVFSPQLFWLFVSFAVLYFVMVRFALPRIGRVIEERSDHIADDLDQAEKLRAQAEVALAEYEAALARARAQAQTISQEMRAKLNKETAEQEARMNERLMARLAEAESRISATRASAMENLETIAADVAGAVVERLSGGRPTTDEVSAAVATARKAM